MHAIAWCYEMKWVFFSDHDLKFPLYILNNLLLSADQILRVNFQMADLGFDRKQGNKS